MMAGIYISNELELGFRFRFRCLLRGYVPPRLLCGLAKFVRRLKVNSGLYALLSQRPLDPARWTSARSTRRGVRSSNSGRLRCRGCGAYTALSFQNAPRSMGLLARFWSTTRARTRLFPPPCQALLRAPPARYSLRAGSARAGDLRCSTSDTTRPASVPAGRRVAVTV